MTTLPVVADINARVSRLRGRIESLASQRKDVRSRRAEAVRKYDELNATADRHSKAQELLNAFAETKRVEIVSKIEAVVTTAIQAMLGPDVRFVLSVDVKRGSLAVQPSVRYKVHRSKKRAPGTPASVSEIEVPLSEVGGGLVDVISFAARVSVLCLTRPKVARIIVADEPFRHVSAEYLPGVASMVRRLADVAGVQFIIVTHEPELRGVADSVVEVSKTGGISVADGDTE